MWMFRARVRCFTVVSHPPPRGQKYGRGGGETGPAGEDASSLKWKTQVMGYYVTNLRGSCGCKSWRLLNAAKRRLTRRMEVVGEPRDLAF